MLIHVYTPQYATRLKSQSNYLITNALAPCGFVRWRHSLFASRAIVMRISLLIAQDNFAGRMVSGVCLPVLCISSLPRAIQSPLSSEESHTIPQYVYIYTVFTAITRVRFTHARARVICSLDVFISHKCAQCANANGTRRFGKIHQSRTTPPHDKYYVFFSSRVFLLFFFSRCVRISATHILHFIIATRVCVCAFDVRECAQGEVAQTHTHTHKVRLTLP